MAPIGAYVESMLALPTSLRDAPQQAFARTVEGLLVGATRALAAHPLASPERHGVTTTRDVAYSSTGLDDHRLDVYRPTNAVGPLPIVVYVHGGAFTILSKDSHWIMALAFARRGYVVFNLSYRLAPKHRYPAAIEDVSAALEWIVDHAADFGGDTTRMAFAGESAGANLVTALTVECTYPREEPFARRVFERGVVPKAVLPACGIYQVSDCDRFARRRDLPLFFADALASIERIYLGPEDTRASELDLADPVCLFERGEPPARSLPPFLLSVGTKDVLLDDTRRLDAALRSLGARSVARYYPGEIHAFHVLLFRDAARAWWQHAFSFLDEHCPPGA